MHSSSMVDLSLGTLFYREYPNGFVERSGHELFPRRWIVEICDCLDMTFVNLHDIIHLSHVEGIAIGVIITHCKI